MKILHREQPELLQLEVEYYAVRDATKKKKVVEAEVGPSIIIVPLDSELLDSGMGSNAPLTTTAGMMLCMVCSVSESRISLRRSQ
jgi:hypothetical protein